MPNSETAFMKFFHKSPPWSELKCPEAITLRQNLESQFGLSVDCLPCDDPLTGKVGFVIFKNDGGNEKKVIIMRQYAPKADNVLLKTMSEMEEQYNTAVERDYLITRHDNPAGMMAGFIVSRGSGRTWYNISLRDVKETMKANG